MTTEQQSRQPTCTTPPEAFSGGSSAATANLTSSSLMLRKSSSYSAVKAEFMKLDVQAISASTSSTAVMQAHRLSTGDINLSSGSIDLYAADDRQRRQAAHKLQKSGSFDLPEGQFRSCESGRDDHRIEAYGAAPPRSAGAPPRSSFSGVPSAGSYNKAAPLHSPVINVNLYRPVLVNGKLWAAPVSPQQLQTQDAMNLQAKNSKTQACTSAYGTGSRMDTASSPNHNNSNNGSSSKWDDAEKWVVVSNSNSSPSYPPEIGIHHHHVDIIVPYSGSQGATGPLINSKALDVVKTTQKQQQQLRASGATTEGEGPSTSNSPFHNYSAHSLGSAAHSDVSASLVRHGNHAPDNRNFINGRISSKQRHQLQRYHRTVDVIESVSEAAHDVYVADVEEDPDFDRPRQLDIAGSTAASGVPAGFVVTDWKQMPYMVDVHQPESALPMPLLHHCESSRSTAPPAAAAAVAAGRTPTTSTNSSKKVIITGLPSAFAAMRDASTDASPQRSDRTSGIGNMKLYAAADSYMTEAGALTTRGEDANRSPTLRNIGTQITPSPSSAASRCSTPLKSPRRHSRDNDNTVHPQQRRQECASSCCRPNCTATSTERIDSDHSRQCGVDADSVNNVNGVHRRVTGSPARPNTPAQVGQQQSLDPPGAGRRSFDRPPASGICDSGGPPPRVIDGTCGVAASGGVAGSSSDVGTRRWKPFETHASSDSTPASSASSGSNNWERSEANDGSKQQLTKLEREEARIDAWEMHQKAKAEAELHKLEMKLGRMRERATEKIMRRIAAVKARAEGMRAAARASKGSGGGGNSNQEGAPEGDAGLNLTNQPQQQAAPSSSSTGIIRRKGCFPILQP